MNKEYRKNKTQENTFITESKNHCIWREFRQMKDRDGDIIQILVTDSPCDQGCVKFYLNQVKEFNWCPYCGRQLEWE
ncbi:MULTISPECIES: hypothetical protein [Aerococcus]|uniref:hypothetical protein n=1 Tax=Aerococcus TaxID=1375 RepID=UPI0018A73490|nr:MULTISPECIES: hypothetical protein [Aerococcus]MCY3067635.1 hypothetical protein [Aerococcus mictus]MCY3080463.1 hypothetical protein [Aerococcus mictus]MDK8484526.1 hypothetical protein [Aerococcus urinae]